jgi:carboxyl-terminal processing protease
MKIRRAYLLLGLAVMGFAGGLSLGRVAPPEGAPRPARLLAALTPLPEETLASAPMSPQASSVRADPVETYYNAMQKIRSSFYGQAGSDETLTYAAIRGMLASLGDRYTRFLEPEEYKEMMDRNRGEFGGIGAKLQRMQNKVVIMEVLKDTPAMRAGLKKGDQIIAVDGENAVGLSITKVVEKIHGQRGSTVKLTVERKDAEKPLVFSIVRDNIEIQVVEAEMVKDHPGIAHIQLHEFNQMSDEKLDQALTDMEKKGMKALILDLRYNPGGLLTEAVSIGSRFIPGGPVVIIQGGGQDRKMMVDPSKQNHKRVPLVVLVNKLSASASEIVSGAIKDTKSGIILGTSTWGKGLVQTITPIQGGSAVLITTHRYLTPAGIDINKKGIMPDIKVEPKAEEIEAGKDPELQEAVAVLEGKQSLEAHKIAEAAKSATVQ